MKMMISSRYSSLFADPEPEDRVGQDADEAPVQQRRQDERGRSVGGIMRTWANRSVYRSIRGNKIIK